MINQLAWSITNLFIRKNEITDEDGEIYAFGFECILANVIQVIVLLIVGLLFDCLLEISLYTLCFTRIKGYIGGYHANTHFTCISGYTLVALGSVYLCGLLPIWTVIAFVSIALIIIYLRAPIQHFNNPKTDDELVTGRKKALLMAMAISIAIVVVYISPFVSYAIYGATGFFIASLSLLAINKHPN